MFKKRFKAIITILAVLILAGSAVIPVLAADESGPETAPSTPFDGIGIRRFFLGTLARTFRYQKSMVIFIGEALESAEDSAGKAIARISDLEKEGSDVRMLEEAVATFEELYDQAQVDQQAALALVDAHAGFDLDGRVTDVKTARDTIKVVEPYLSGAREHMIDAIQTITAAVKEFRNVNQELVLGR